MRLYDQFFHDMILLSPSINDSLNLSKYKYLRNQMENPYSKEFKKNEELFYKKYLNVLKTKKKINIYDEVIDYLCNQGLKLLKTNLTLTPINHQENIVTILMEMASGENMFILKTNSDFDLFLEKIKNFDELIDTIIENMRTGIKKKYTLPRLLVTELIQQLELSVKTKSYYYRKSKKNNYNKQLDIIFIPHVTRLIDFLKLEYLKKSRNTIGMCDLPNGTKEYKILLENTLTLKMNIKDIHQYGLDEVKRIQECMMGVKNKMNFKGTLKEFNVFLRKQKHLNYASKKELLLDYKSMLKTINNTIMKDYFYNKIRSKCELVTVPKFNENFSAEAYYYPGDLENTRNGKFFINLRDIKDNSKMEIEALTLHEADPGHHYQITYVNENKNIPLFVKIIVNDAYQEGWALYCENLGDYKTDESYYGKLIMEMIRALRLVVDTGIHYYGWSYKKTFNYYKKYSFDSDEQIKTQILRYIALPTQALSYKIGELYFLNKFRNEIGDINEIKSYNKTKVKTFHDNLLKYGPIPFFLMDKYN